MVSHPAYANNRQQAVAAERIGAPCRLLSLADELILAIIERIDSHETLVNLCATCPRLQALTEPYSFKSRLVRTGDQAERLAHVLMSRMERLDYVKVLSIRYVWEDEQGIEILSDLMKIGLHNIRDLTIESPCLNNDPWRNDPQLPWRSACRIDIGGMLRAAALRSDPVSEIPVLPHLQSRKFNLIIECVCQTPTSDSNSSYPWLGQSQVLHWCELLCFPGPHFAESDNLLLRPVNTARRGRPAVQREVRHNFINHVNIH